MFERYLTSLANIFIYYNTSDGSFTDSEFNIAISLLWIVVFNCLMVVTLTFAILR